MLKTYRDLIVWRRAMELVKEEYQILSFYPRSESTGLVCQIKKSVLSIPSNIAEGKMRFSIKEFRRFLLIAYASGAELETKLNIGKMLNFGNLEDYKKAESLLSEVMRMLNKMTYNKKF